MVIKQHIIRFSLLPACCLLLVAAAPWAQAKPRLMADAEMDQVCAKGSVGFSVDPVTLNQIVFEFSRQTTLGVVSGSGVVTVEVLPSASGQTRILLGAPITVGTQTAPGAVLPTSIQVVNGTVRVSGDLTINLDTLPSVMRALQQNRTVLPPEFNPLAGRSGLGAVHP